MEFTIDIHGEINEELISEVVYKLRSIYDYNEDMLNTYINPVDMYEGVELDIDTCGGLITGFMQIRKEINKLKNQGVKITTYVSGLAYSCGFLLTLLGTERRGDKLSSFLYHRGGCQLGYDKVDNNARFLDHQKTILDVADDFVIKNTNIEKEELNKYRDIDWYLNYSEALSLGILTEEKEDEEVVLTESMCIETMKQAGYKVVSDEVWNERELERSSRLNVEVK